MLLKHSVGNHLVRLIEDFACDKGGNALLLKVRQPTVVSNILFGCCALCKTAAQRGVADKHSLDVCGLSGKQVTASLGNPLTI